ncbi:MAG: inner membrane-spanning protein YciB [Pseudomonadota bacterium]
MSEGALPDQRRLSGGAKFAVDFVPLLIFMGAYFLGGRLVGVAGGLAGEEWRLREGAEMYLAVALFMPAFALAFAYSVWKERRVAPMLLVSGVIIGVLGTLTLILQNKIFFYMKPTIVYLLFGGVLAAGLATERNFLKTVFDGALHMSDAAWRILTKRYVVFFVALGVLNEIAWRWLTRDCAPEAPSPAGSGAWSWLLAAPGAGEGPTCAGEADWVRLKAIGFTVISLVFTGFQAPFIAKHMQEDGAGKDPA